MENDMKRGGGPQKDTRITMTVDTKKINDGNVAENVFFSDDRDDPPQKPGKPEEYVSTVNKGKNVSWVPKAKDDRGGDTVEIVEINVKEGKGNWKLLEDKPHRGNSGETVAKVRGQSIDGEDAYYVKFRIKGREHDFIVDPKLKMAD